MDLDLIFSFILIFYPTLLNTRRNHHNRNIHQPNNLNINYLNNNLINHNSNNSPRIMMVMDRVRERHNDLTEHHRRMIKQQNRAPDSRYNINVTNSDHQSLDRPITDTVPEICKSFHYDLSSLPPASIIMPFYNEALSMLLRAVHSILNRSPDVLLHEVILVDDHSTDLHLQDTLREYVHMLPKVKLLRNVKREGLIVSRIRGSSVATASVIIFLDAHTEVGDRWLEPLLNEVHKHPNQVLQPFVNAIDTMSLVINKPDVYHKGSFSWDLRYTWLKVTDHEEQTASNTGLPFFTPTLVGCAIAVHKDYFNHIGKFDEGMKVWGGENIELAFRTWMCGGKVKTVTCSHVGHVFKEFPYSFDGNKEVIVQKNLIRVAETWMDGLKKFFYASTFIFPYKRTHLTEEEDRTLMERKNLRRRLKCKNFEWYMYNVIPQLQTPSMQALYHGEITNDRSRMCWEVTEDYFIAMTYVCYHHKIIPSNYFSITKDGLLRYRDKCILLSAEDPMLRLDECPWGRHQIEEYGVWSIQQTEQTVVRGFLQVRVRLDNNNYKRFCLEQVTNANHKHKGLQMPQLSNCNDNNPFQLWSFTFAFDFSLVPHNSL